MCGINAAIDSDQMNGAPGSLERPSTTHQPHQMVGHIGVNQAGKESRFINSKDQAKKKHIYYILNVLFQ